MKIYELFRLSFIDEQMSQIMMLIFFHIFMLPLVVVCQEEISSIMKLNGSRLVVLCISVQVTANLVLPTHFEKINYIRERLFIYLFKWRGEAAPLPVSKDTIFKPLITLPKCSLSAGEL
jgi:hypothetical protein